jgi:hypothetical protein
MSRTAEIVSGGVGFLIANWFVNHWGITALWLRPSSTWLACAREESSSALRCLGGEAFSGEAVTARTVDRPRHLLDNALHLWRKRKAAKKR